jgi:hypothetical protein
MIKILVLVLAASLLWSVNAFAQQVDYEAICAKECNYLTKDCTAYIDCRVAKSSCLESCMQRKVWEKVAGSIDRLTTVLEQQVKDKEEKEDGSKQYISSPTAPVVQENVTAEASYISDSEE